MSPSLELEVQTIHEHPLHRKPLCLTLERSHLSPIAIAQPLPDFMNRLGFEALFS
ncbi:hypothetical protein [Acaryochloris thomasi]|uniref:hypothetical protein n=1 Tax=Acaryochloris thomasi TaxID=2929456 RepID=UPI001313EF2B|nr:hypothetical protein [Acaryochloris thomasi]